MTIKKTMLASLIALTMMSGMAHADSLEGALTELEAITAGMSQAEINQKIERFIERAPAGTSVENVLSDFPLAHFVPETHQVAPHLDGIHQNTVTPHLDAPVIDRSSHLDSNVTDAEHQAAQKAAEEHVAAYRHNNPEGSPTQQIAPTAHPDDQHNATQTVTPADTHQNDQRTLTTAKYASANAPHNGVDGKDGHSITGKTGANGKDADMTLVNANTAGLRGVRTEQVAQGRYIQQNGANIAVNQAHIASNTAAISKNSQDIAANRKDIDENSKDIKRVGAMAQAVSSLHYNRNESGYAVAAGEYDGESSIAGGMQFSTSQDSAVTVQVSWDGNATGAGVGFHSNF